MRTTNQFSLEPAAGHRDRRISQVCREGLRTGTIVPGCDLEAQIDTGSGWLLFITHDVPFEEALEICLLSPDCGLVDSASISWPLTTALFGNLSINAADQVEFDFLGSRRWRIRLFDGLRFRLPLPLVSDRSGYIAAAVSRGASRSATSDAVFNAGMGA